MKAGMSCVEMVLRLDDYVDRALSPLELESVESHLLGCVTCTRQFRFEISLIRGLRERLHGIRAPDDLMGRIRTRLATELAG
jgi:hypothetical protein